MSEEQKTPQVTVDEALELFLAITYPNGIPDDIDKEKLFKKMKEKIAQDRPVWAEASKEKEQKQEKAKSNAQANLFEKHSGIDEPPTDPDELYLWERRKKANEASQKKKEEQRENEIREHLRQELIQKNKECDDTVLEKAFKIRQEIEARVKKNLGIQFPHLTQAYTEQVLKKENPSLSFSQEKPETLQENVALSPLQNESPTNDTDNVTSYMDDALNVSQTIKNENPQIAKKIEELSVYNAMKRGEMASRDDIVYKRKLKKQYHERIGFSKKTKKAESDDKPSPKQKIKKEKQKLSTESSSQSHEKKESFNIQDKSEKSAQNAIVFSQKKEPEKKTKINKFLQKRENIRNGSKKQKSEKKEELFSLNTRKEKEKREKKPIIKKANTLTSDFNTKKRVEKIKSEPFATSGNKDFNKKKESLLFTTLVKSKIDKPKTSKSENMLSKRNTLSTKTKLSRSDFIWDRKKIKERDYKDKKNNFDMGIDSRSKKQSDGFELE